MSRHPLPTCNSCTFQNPVGSTQCQICGLAISPSHLQSAPSPFISPNTSSRLQGATDSESDAKWNCKQCTLANDISSSACAMCGHPSQRVASSPPVRDDHLSRGIKTVGESTIRATIAWKDFAISWPFFREIGSLVWHYVDLSSDIAAANVFYQSGRKTEFIISIIILAFVPFLYVALFPITFCYNAQNSEYPFTWNNYFVLVLTILGFFPLAETYMWHVHGTVLTPLGSDSPDSDPPSSEEFKFVLNNDPRQGRLCYKTFAVFSQTIPQCLLQIYSVLLSFDEFDKWDIVIFVCSISFSIGSIAQFLIFLSDSGKNSTTGKTMSCFVLELLLLTPLWS